jgi:hypothetical protein
MKYLVCACAILCASAFCGIGLMSKASESGYAVSLAQVAAQ